MKSNKRIVLTNENPSNVDIELFNYSGYFLYHIENIDKYLYKIIYVFLTIFLYLLKCPQSLILSALRAFLLLW